MFEQEPQIDSPTANLRPQAEASQAAASEPAPAPGGGEASLDASEPGAPTQAAANKRTPRVTPPSAGVNRTKFLSTRAPAELGFAVDLAILELGMSGFNCDKGELLAALVSEHVKSDDRKLAALRRAVETFRREYGE